MTKYNILSLYNLHGWFSCRTVVLILAKKATNNLPKFPEQKFGQSDPTANLQFVKDFNPYVTRPILHGEIICTD